MDSFSGCLVVNKTHLRVQFVSVMVRKRLRAFSRF